MSAGPVLHRFHDQYGDRVAFLTLYVREAHPGEVYPQPETMSGKIARAYHYQMRDDLRWPVAVDSIEGRIHRQLDGKSNAAYFIDAGGRVVFKSLWSNDERALRRGFEAAVEGGAPGVAETRLIPMLAGTGVMYRTLSLSGPSAKRTARRQVPPMYAMASIARLFRPLSPAARGAAALGLSAVAAGLVGYGIVRLLRR